MARYTIEIDETFNVPRNRVFALFADHSRFGQMLGAPVRRIRDSAGQDPNGTGSVRCIGVGPLGLKETVLSFEPNSLIEYTISSLSPIRNHLGRICFEDAAEGQTRLHYTITFEDILPFSGRAVKATLEYAIRKGIRQVPHLA